jgi:hypothetical protein
MDNKDKLKAIKGFFTRYKKRIIFFTIGSGLVYYLYRTFLAEKIQMLREFYQKMSEYNEVMNSSSNFENISKQYENSFSNLLNRLLEDIKQKLENQFSLNGCFSVLQNAPKDDLPRMWILFKNKAFLVFYSAIFITRCMQILSQSHLLILEKQTIDLNYPKSFYEELLNDLWLIAVQFIEYLTKTLENKLTPLAEEIKINQPITKEKFVSFFRTMREKTEEVVYNSETKNIHFNIFEKYFKDIENKINLLQINDYKNDMKSMKIHSFLKFYQTYYDVVTSNIFQVILIKGLDYDFKIVEDTIELNFENERKNNPQIKEVSVPKIASFIYRMFNQMMDPDNTIFLIRNYKNDKYYEELSEYYRVIFDK